MIRNVRISHETKKAYLFIFVSGKNSMWVPKSCVLSMEREPNDKSVPTGIIKVDIKDSFYDKFYIKPKKAKRIPYDDKAEINHYHKTNRKSSYLTKKMREIRDRKP